MPWERYQKFKVCAGNIQERKQTLYKQLSLQFTHEAYYQQQSNGIYQDTLSSPILTQGNSASQIPNTYLKGYERGETHFHDYS